MLKNKHKGIVIIWITLHMSLSIENLYVKDINVLEKSDDKSTLYLYVPTSNYYSLYVIDVFLKI